MNIGYIIENIIKDENSSGWINFEMFGNELNLDQNKIYNISGEDNKNLRGYYFAQHLCTDTHVGWQVYFLNDEPVCVSKQDGRKSNEIIIGWISKETAEKTRDYIISIYPKEEEFDNEIDIINLNDDIGEGYPVEYVGQLLTKKVIYKNQVVPVIEAKSFIDGKINFHTIKIIFNDKEIEVDIRDCLSPFLINN